MLLKGIVDEDFSNYKKPSMLLAFPYCSFKCGTLCQNLPIAKSKNIEYELKEILNQYYKNNITTAIVCGGLEPLDSFDDLLELLTEFRKISNDDFVVYTGFDESEIYDKIALLSYYENVIIKFGRFIPNQESHYDKILGVNLVSPNQYAKIIGEKNERL